MKNKIHNYRVRSRRYYYWGAVYKTALIFFYTFVQTTFTSFFIARPARIRTFPGHTLLNGDVVCLPRKLSFRTLSRRVSYENFIRIRSNVKRIDFENGLDLFLISSDNASLQISYGLRGNFNAGRKRLYAKLLRVTVHNTQGARFCEVAGEIFTRIPINDSYE